VQFTKVRDSGGGITAGLLMNIYLRPFPAIYRESSGMHHLELRGMRFENGGTDPFVEEDLNRNVDATNSKAIGSAEEFLNLLQ
jgi:hypothetical protein